MSVAKQHRPLFTTRDYDFHSYGYVIRFTEIDMDSLLLSRHQIQLEVVYPHNDRDSIAQKGSSSSPGWFFRSQSSQLCETIDIISSPVVHIGASRTTKPTCQVEDSAPFQLDYFQFLWPFLPWTLSRSLSSSSTLNWTYKIKDLKLGAVYNGGCEMYIWWIVWCLFFCAWLTSLGI